MGSTWRISSRLGAGYIVDNSTSDCYYCAYSVGDQLFEPLGYSFNHRWRDLGILAAFIGSNLILLFFAVSDLRHNLRDILKLINYEAKYLNFNKR